MRRTLILAAATALLNAAAAPAAGYDRSGTYIDQGTVRFRDTADVRLDSHGIPLVRRPSGWVRNPVTISAIGLSEYSYWVWRNDQEALRSALRQARWFVRTQRRDGSWPYQYDFPVGGMDVTMRSPWISAMAQGMAASLLWRAYRKTCHRSFLRAARDGLEPLTRSVDRGGTLASLRGGAFYEEYPTRPASFTLNGFMYTLFGLYDLRRVSPQAHRLYVAGRRTLIRTLRLFDPGGISAYHLGFRTDPPRPVLRSEKYHRVHVVGLTVLDRMHPHSTLRRYRDKWARLLPEGRAPRIPSRSPDLRTCR